MTALIHDHTAAPERIEAEGLGTVECEFSDFLISEGHTGAVGGKHGQAWIGLVDATSDDVPNEVDLSYLTLCHPVWLVRRGPPHAPSLADLVSDLKDRLDLPVEDVAAMVGVGRRHFYNLMSGATVSSAREAWIRVLHAIVDDLDVAVGGDRGRLRAAILMPVGERFESVYAAAEGGDLDHLRTIGSEVVRRIEAGEVAGMIDRPAPHLQRLVSPEAAARVSDHLRGDPPQSDGEGDGVDS